MNFNRHSDLAGSHAILSPSNYYWIRYDDEKLLQVFDARMEAQRGTDYHAFAAQAITLRVKLPESKKTLNMYVNDGIGYLMKVEQTLKFSRNCFGTADAIQFRNGMLRIHDLKMGVNESSMDQLKIYMALFCYEFEQDPFDIKAELRIYQNDDMRVLSTDRPRNHEEFLDPDDIVHIQDKMVTFDRLIEQRRLELSS